jgi:hypothetical protein
MGILSNVEGELRLRLCISSKCLASKTLEESARVTATAAVLTVTKWELVVKTVKEERKTAENECRVWGGEGAFDLLLAVGAEGFWTRLGRIAPENETKV